MTYLPPDSEYTMANSLLALIADPKAAKANIAELKENTEAFKKQADDIREQSKRLDAAKAEHLKRWAEMDARQKDLDLMSDEWRARKHEQDLREQELSEREAAVQKSEVVLADKLQEHQRKVAELAQRESDINSHRLQYNIDVDRLHKDQEAFNSRLAKYKEI